MKAPRKIVTQKGPGPFFQKGAWPHLVLILTFALFVLAASLHAAEDSEMRHRPLARPFVVMGRGFGNILGLPFEILRTAAAEHEVHPKLWPVTYIPRLATHAIIRVASSVNDIVLLPWVAPFADDLTSWSESMGLPDYPWQRE